MEHSGRRIVKETMWSFLTKALSFVLLFGVNVILSRNLSPEQFGHWSFMLSAMTLAVLVGSLGLDGSTKKHIASAAPGDYAKFILNSLALRVASSALVAVSCFGILHYAWPEAEIRIGMVTYIFLLSLVTYFKEIHFGLHDLRSCFFINLSSFGIRSLGVAWLVVRGQLTLLSILCSFIVGELVTTVAFAVITYRRFSVQKARLDRTIALDIVRYASPLFLTAIGFAVASEMDTIMLRYFSNSTQVAYYAVAKSIVHYVPHLNLALALGVLPVFARITANNSRELKKRLTSYIVLTSLLALVAILAIFLWADIWIPTIFGIEYSNSVLSLKILSLYLFVNANSMYLSGVLDYAGCAKKRAINLGFSLLLNIALNCLLMPPYGSVGAAVSMSVSYLPYTLLNAREVHRLFTSHEEV